MLTTGGWIIAGLAVAVVACFASGKGVRDRVVVQTRLSPKNPLTWIIIGLIIYFISVNHLW